MNDEQVEPIRLDPFPPYQGLDNDYSGSGAYSEPFRDAVTIPASSEPTDSVEFQFEISVSGNKIVVSGGSVANTLEEAEEVEDPANGVWYAEVGVRISQDDGTILSTLLQWVQEPSAKASTDEHVDVYSVVGTVEVVDGTPDVSTINQGNYGPVVAIPHGGTDNRWEVLLF